MARCVNANVRTCTAATMTAIAWGWLEDGTVAAGMASLLQVLAHLEDRVAHGFTALRSSSSVHPRMKGPVADLLVLLR